MYTFDVRKRIAMQILIECCYVGFSIASWLTGWLAGWMACVSEREWKEETENDVCTHIFYCYHPYSTDVGNTLCMYHLAMSARP